MIHQGQLLADGAQLYARIASTGQRQSKPGTTSLGAAGGNEEADEEEGAGGAGEQSAGTTWLHCSVGPQLKEGEEEDGKVQVGDS